MSLFSIDLPWWALIKFYHNLQVLKNYNFCYFSHWADVSAGGSGVPEDIYIPVAIYGMMIFWISLNLGMASDIQYTRVNNTCEQYMWTMHVHLRNSNNECRLCFKISDHMQKLRHSGRDLVLVETCPVHQSDYVLKLFLYKLWFILF